LTSFDIATTCPSGISTAIRALIPSAGKVSGLAKQLL
jgi:hypothetical protein